MEFMWRSWWLCLLIGLVSGQQRSRAISSSASSGSSTPVDFECPEEFGYYPHPTDCTQYYVCVFGGALLESCTGGLVYSHELQTCDWPRNVQCVPGQVQISAKSRTQSSTSRPKVDLRTRKPGTGPVLPSAPITSEERFTSSASHPFVGNGNALSGHDTQRPSASRSATFSDDNLELQNNFDPNREGRLLRHPLPNEQQPEGRKVGNFNNRQQTIPREPERPTFVSSHFDDIDLDYNQQILGGFNPHSLDRNDFIPYGDFARRQGNARWSERPVQEFEFIPTRPRATPSMQFKRNMPRLPLDQFGPVPIRNVHQLDSQPSGSQSLGSFHQSLQQDFQRPNVQDTPSPAFPVPRPFSAPVPLPVNSNRRPVLNTHFDTRQFGPANFPPLHFNSNSEQQNWQTSNADQSDPFRPSHAQNRSPNLNPFDNFRQPTPRPVPERDEGPRFTSSSSTTQARPISRPFPPQFFDQLPPSAQFPNEQHTETFFEGQSGLGAPETTPSISTAPVRPSVITSSGTREPASLDDLTTFATESPTTLTRQTATEEIHSLRDRPEQSFEEPAPSRHNGNQFLVETQFATDPRDEDFNTWGSQFQTTTRDQQQTQQQQKQQQSQPAPRPRPIPNQFFDSQSATQNRPASGNQARPVFQFEEVVPKPQQQPVRISRPTTEAPVQEFDHSLEEFSRPQSPAPAAPIEDTFYPVEEHELTDLDYDTASVPENENVNWQNSQSGEVLSEEFIKPRTTTTTSTTTPTPSTRRSATTTTTSTTSTTTTTTTPRPTTRQSSRVAQSDEKSRGSTRHQSSKPVQPDDDDDSPTPLSSNKRVPGRPTLKPVSDLVSSKAEPFDVSRFPPSRPAARFAQPRVDESAAKCNADICQLPDCSCGGKEIPSELKAHQVPQLVLLTFDDAVNDLNKELYSDLFETGRLNPNGCPIAATFYVSHEWTDYGQVQSLYADGHEIASHTVSHSFGEQFGAKKWAKEAAGQRDILAAYGGVKPEDVRGLRAPFLSIGGNKMFKMLYDMNFTYDSSMPVYENKPPSWPYTLDYKIFHDCMIPPCPTKSYPGVWEVPMVMWQDLNGGRCSMGDGCSNPPDAEGVYKMLIKNFERHYTSNRAPFPLYYHAAWFTTAHHKEGFEAFLDTIVAMDDVWLVTNWQAIQWVRDPTPLDKIKSFKPFECDYQDRPKRCSAPRVCNSWHKSGVRYMRSCQACPDVFPWTGKTGVRNAALDNYAED